MKGGEMLVANILTEAGEQIKKLQRHNRRLSEANAKMAELLFSQPTREELEAELLRALRLAFYDGYMLERDRLWVKARTAELKEGKWQSEPNE